MKKTFFACLVCMTALCLQAQNTGRVVTNFNFGWKFHAGDVADGAAVALNDADWRSVNLPHDFQIEQPWVAPSPDERPDNSDAGANIKSRLSARGYKEMGKGWYRKTFVAADSLKGKRVLLDFQGVLYTADVYLNGERIGGTDYGYVGFDIDISQKLNYGKENVIAVMADTRGEKNSRWYTGAGIYRDVNLVVTDPNLYFARHPLYITTKDNHEVNVQVEVGCRLREDSLRVELEIKNPQGETVKKTTNYLKRNRRMRQQELQLPAIDVPNAQLWDCEHPNLYTAVATIYRPDGTVADCVSDRFGIRTVEFSPDCGMKLNGKKVLLKGYANHHTLGALGAAAYPRAIEKRIQLIKAFGMNHIRTSHNPYSESFLRLCDENGILVVDELYDKWNTQYTGGRVEWQQLWQHDVPEFIKRDRNHPCVVLWSLGNELQQDENVPYQDWGVTAFKLQKALLQRYDTTRLVTVAMHPRFRNWETDSLPCDLAMITDVQAYNYRYMYFPGDGRRFPHMKFYQSEASTAAMGPNFFEMDLNKVIGLAYWGAIDYLGESQGWPAKGWAQGVFDIALEPKPKAYFMKSFFSEEPVVHIAVVDNKNSVMWNGVQTGNDGMSDHWNREAGKQLEIITYTNADEVELVLNGKSLGKKTNNKNNPKERNQIKWNNITYADGYLEAVGRTNGKIVARHRIETTGDAVRLTVSPDNSNWKADGMDLQHVRVYAVDKKGRRVPMAQDELRFSVEGDASIVAVSSGNHQSDELNATDHRKLYNGSALVILRAGKTAGEVVLKTEADGYKTVKTKLQTR